MRSAHLLPLAAAAAAVANAAAPPPAAFTLKLFSPETSQWFGSACLDGSPAGYYLSEPPPASAEGSSSDSSLYVIFMEGGGACWSNSGLFSCWPRYNTSLGSSKFWPPTYSQDNNFFTRDCSVNPLFCGATFVEVPYCTGDVYAGQRMGEINASWPFHFSGHNNIVAIVSDLLNTTGIGGNYVDVLVAGSSAGGFGTFFNADYIASKLPLARVRANPQGGYFFPHVVPYILYELGFRGPPYAGEDAGIADVWQAYGNSACIAAYNMTYCSTVSNFYPFVKTPMFITENEADSNQIFVELGCPMESNPSVDAFVQYFATNMQQSLLTNVAAKPGDGVFAPGCLAHTNDTTLQSPVIINGTSVNASFSSWWLGDHNAPTFLVESCGAIPCNPTCPTIPSSLADTVEPWDSFLLF